MRRLIRILILATVAGVLLAAAKGQGGGARLAFGNISAPWLLVAFLAGTRYGRLERSAAVGLLATFAALAGFYAEPSPIFDVGSRSVDFLANPAQVFDFIVWAHHSVFIGGTVSGLLFGVLGGVWTQRRSPLAAGIMALMFIVEPAAWIAAPLARGARSGWMTQYWWLGLAEVAVGLGGAAAVVYARRSAKI